MTSSLSLHSLINKKLNFSGFTRFKKWQFYHETSDSLELLLNRPNGVLAKLCMNEMFRRQKRSAGRVRIKVEGWKNSEEGKNETSWEWHKRKHRRNKKHERSWPGFVSEVAKLNNSISSSPRQVCFQCETKLRYVQVFGQENCSSFFLAVKNNCISPLIV